MSETMLGEGEPPPRKRAAEQEEKHQADPLALHGAVTREMADPKDGLAPMPIWLTLFYFAIVGWGGYYLASNHGGFRADGYAERSAPVEPTVTKPVDLAVIGRQVYNNCVPCHQENGSGLPGVYPPLSNSEWVTGRPEILIRILLQGLQGDISVRGETYNGTMPAWQHLKDEHIAGVTTLIRTSFGNDAGKVDPALVATVRKNTQSRTQPWSAAELKEIASSLPPEGPPATPAQASTPPNAEAGVVRPAAPAQTQSKPQ